MGGRIKVGQWERRLGLATSQSMSTTSLMTSYIFFLSLFLPTPLFGMGVDDHEAFPAVEINALIHSGLGFS